MRQKIRAAVSRVYYAAFWAALKLVEKTEELRYAEGSHAKVWEYLYGDACTEDGTIGNAGDLLRKQRKHADYIGNKKMTEWDLSLAMKRAAAIITSIDRVNVGPSPQP